MIEFDEKSVSERFQVFADAGMWQGEDEHTKNFPIGNVVNYILSQLSLYKQTLREKMKERDGKMYGYYKSVFEDEFEGGYPTEWDNFLEE